MTDFFQFSCSRFSNNVELSLDEYTNYGLDMEAHNHVQHLHQFSSSPELTGFPVHRTTVNGIASSDVYSTLEMEELELILRGDIEDVSGWLKGSEEKACSLMFQQSNNDGGKNNKYCTFSPSNVSSDTSIDETSVIQQQALSLPSEEMLINNQLSLNHLIKAYVEAVENEQAEVAEVIVGRISEKVSPIGEVWERLLYYTFHPSNKQADYLKQESQKNSSRAFEAFNRIYPFCMLAHFTANSAILETMPPDVHVLHVVDFDIGEGLQWSSMIMELGHYQRQDIGSQYYTPVSMQMTLRITAIKWEEGESSCHVPYWTRFEETKKRLHDYASSFGVILKVEEIELQDLVSEMRKARRRGSGRSTEWLVFNCMWALPHMGRMRSRRTVMEFMSIAKELLSNNGYCNPNYRGAFTFGNGGAWEIFKSNPSFGSFFSSFMDHYQALLGSIEWNIPIRLAEARVAIECLFISPYVSSLTWMQEWEEMIEVCDFQVGLGFEGLRLCNKESLDEAREMVREGETPYEVRIEGDNNNEMVLQWKGTPLIRISAWR
ncbi:hypothetical protein K2173_000055 [Erythroxylum novogranatense]|uniref:Uncharacterized protein n=1 Tax=Erythroxylum novogranatense TaxID=1862640 RepID=A0AAV8SNB6_9ROSI|nr:hypothetical protein K2173_000055 [Erythroxylum novogranatense]